VRPNWPTRAEAERPWAGEGITDFDEVRVGQVVIAHGRSYPGLTEGKEYTVVGYQPRDVGPSFTFPPYITVMGDHGSRVTAHCHRFRRPTE
jgi:hypothetical protein